MRNIQDAYLMMTIYVFDYFINYSTNIHGTITQISGQDIFRKIEGFMNTQLSFTTGQSSVVRVKQLSCYAMSLYNVFHSRSCVYVLDVTLYNLYKDSCPLIG